MIKEMPESEKPRERFLQVGVDNLSNEELISIIIRTGVKNISVKDVSLNILSKVKNIENLNNMSINYLKDIKGVGIIKAMTLLSAIELGKRVLNNQDILKSKVHNSHDIYNYFKNYFINEKQEKLIAVYLDIKKNIIDYDVIFVGTLNQSVVHPRDIFNKSILNNASGVIIIHNHPSGDVTPSNHDIEFTNQMIESGKMLGIFLIDHIIMGNNNYYSFIDNR